MAASLCPHFAWATSEDFEDFGELARVIDGDSFVLTSGLKVRLANVFAPEEGAPLTKEARNALSTLIASRPLGLAYHGAKRDRYGRALAQVYTLKPDGSRDQWIQSEMIRLGYARVRSYADTAWETANLLNLETRITPFAVLHPTSWPKM
jgi:endonuclease YncB( thermonuclease family)